MTWKTVIVGLIGVVVVGVIDELVGGLSHAAVLALGVAVAAIALITTTPDAGGLREPRED